MRFFSEEHGSTAGRKQTSIINGVTRVFGLNPGSTYEHNIRNDNVFNDDNIRNQDEWLILNPNPTDISNRSQDLLMPQVSGNMNVNWTKYPNYAALSRWRKMQAVIAQNRANGHLTNYDTVTTVGPISTTITHKFVGCILIPDGRLVVVGSDSLPYLFDPSTNIMTQFGTNAPITGGVIGVGILPNGNVIGVPSANAQAFIIDPINLTSNNYGIVDSSATKYTRGCLLPNGQFAMFARVKPQLGLFDFINGNITNIGPSITQTNPKFYGGVLLVDGRILEIPTSYVSFILLDPVDGTSITFGNDATLNKMVGGCLLADETVYCQPSNASQISIVNPTTQTIQLVGPSDSSTIKYNGSILLPDGRVFNAASNKSQHQIYNPITQTMTPVGLVNNTTNKFIGTRLLPDGRIFCSAYGASQCEVISASDGNYGVLPDLDTCLSAYLNHG